MYGMPGRPDLPEPDPPTPPAVRRCPAYALRWPGEWSCRPTTPGPRRG